MNNKDNTCSTNIKNWQNEWKIIHHEHENYERCSLFIKLVAIIVCCTNIAFNFPLIVSTLLMLTLWLQEAIWKTFQSRLTSRLIFIEQSIGNSTSDNSESLKSSENGAFQLYSCWQDQRSGSKGLMAEYIANTLRPTIMFPYVILILINLIFVLL